MCITRPQGKRGTTTHQCRTRTKSAIINAFSDSISFQKYAWYLLFRQTNSMFSFDSSMLKRLPHHFPGVDLGFFICSARRQQPMFNSNFPIPQYQVEYHPSTLITSSMGSACDFAQFSRNAISNDDRRLWRRRPRRWQQQQQHITRMRVRLLCINYCHLKRSIFQLWFYKRCYIHRRTPIWHSEITTIAGLNLSDANTS